MSMEQTETTTEQYANREGMRRASKLDQEIRSLIDNGVSPDTIQVVQPQDGGEPWVRITTE